MRGVSLSRNDVTVRRWRRLCVEAEHFSVDFRTRDMDCALVRLFALEATGMESRGRVSGVGVRAE
jgi:hypothetical protein